MGSPRILTTVFLAVFFLVIAVTGSAIASEKDDEPVVSGTVLIDETEFMLLLGGSSGDGSLVFQDETYKFKAKGFKLGGVGVHSVHLTGDVYHLNDVKDFSGTYFETEAMITVGVGKGAAWVKNSNGVTIHFKSDAEGLALGLGLDGLKLTLEE